MVIGENGILGRRNGIDGRERTIDWRNIQGGVKGG
jgi:hypothetical protein